MFFLRIYLCLLFGMAYCATMPCAVSLLQLQSDFIVIVIKGLQQELADQQEDVPRLARTYRYNFDSLEQEYTKKLPAPLQELERAISPLIREEIAVLMFQLKDVGQKFIAQARNYLGLQLGRLNVELALKKSEFVMPYQHGTQDEFIANYIKQNFIIDPNTNKAAWVQEALDPIRNKLTEIWQDYIKKPPLLSLNASQIQKITKRITKSEREYITPEKTAANLKKFDISSEEALIRERYEQAGLSRDTQINQYDEKSQPILRALEKEAHRIWALYEQEVKKPTKPVKKPIADYSRKSLTKLNTKIKDALDEEDKSVIFKKFALLAQPITKKDFVQRELKRIITTYPNIDDYAVDDQEAIGTTADLLGKLFAKVKK